MFKRKKKKKKKADSMFIDGANSEYPIMAQNEAVGRRDGSENWEQNILKYVYLPT